MTTPATGPSAPRWFGGPGARRPTPPRRQLSHEQIIDAALRILDAEGLDAVSMRRVAQALETGAASLYAHVKNKDDLLEAVFDRVVAEVPVPPVGSAHWRDQMVDYYVSMRKVLVAHRDLARFALARIPTGPHALLVTERCLEIMRLSGLPDQVIAWSCDLLPLYVTASAYEESIYQSRFPGATPAQIGEFLSGVLAFFSALPTEHFPNIVRLSDAMTKGDGDERFRFGLEVFLRGLEGYAVAHAKDTPT